MTATSQRPHEAGAGNSVIADTKSNTRISPAAQAQIIALRRDFVCECLRIAALKAAHGAGNVEIGDTICAGRDIRIALENLREAASSFRQLQIDEGELLP